MNGENRTLRRNMEQDKKTSALGSIMGQGGDHSHESCDTIPELMGQGSSTKRKHTGAKSMRTLMGQ